MTAKRKADETVVKIASKIASIKSEVKSLLKDSDINQLEAFVSDIGSFIDLGGLTGLGDVAKCPCQSVCNCKDQCTNECNNQCSCNSACGCESQCPCKDVNKDMPFEQVSYPILLWDLIRFYPSINKLEVHKSGLKIR